MPVQFLLPWDDQHVDRQSALGLFDAFASAEKTLHANPGDHRTIRWTGLSTGTQASVRTRRIAKNTNAAVSTAKRPVSMPWNVQNLAPGWYSTQL